MDENFYLPNNQKKGRKSKEKGKSMKIDRTSKKIDEKTTEITIFLSRPVLAGPCPSEFGKMSVVPSSLKYLPFVIKTVLETSSRRCPGF